MSVLHWIRFHLWDPISTVSGLVNRWNPGLCESEKDYEKSLLAFIEENLPGVEVVKQYGVARSRVDIVIGSFNKVAVELKKDLNSTSKVQRLIGQLRDYRDTFENIVVVLCGDNQGDLVQRVRDEGDSLEALFEVIEK